MFLGEKKEKKRLYKKGKFWVTAATVIVSAVGVTVAADEVTVPSTSSDAQTLTTTEASSSEEKRQDTSVVTSSESSAAVVSEEKAESKASQGETTASTVTNEVTVEKETSDEKKAETKEVSDSSSSLSETVSTASTPIVSTSSATQEIGGATGDHTESEKEQVVTSVQVDAKGLKVQYNSIVNRDEKLYFAVWSEVNGQDDLVWYDANATGAAYVEFSRHKYSYGKYNVHTYINKNGKTEGVNATSVELAKPSATLTITNKNETQGQFDVVVTDLKDPFGVKSVKLPIWSEVNGQDDLKWYTAAKQTDGSYKVTVKASDHRYSEGIYNIHLYLEEGNGRQVGVAHTTTDLKLAKPTGTLSIENKNNQKGQFDVVVRDVVDPYGLTSIKLPVWSEVNGQDDLKWYTAIKQTDGSYKVTVKASDHKKSSGKYHVHMYYEEQIGRTVGVATTTTELILPTTSGRVAIENLDSKAGRFDVHVTDLVTPNGLREVKVPVWSEVNGQDDLKWYTAAKRTDGSYKVTVQINHHKNSTGKYFAHVYVEEADGRQVGIAHTEAVVSTVQPSGTVKIENKDNEQGQFTVRITDVVAPYGLQEVLVPVWSATNGQDDLKWYSGNKQADGSYLVRVKASDHYYSTGKYDIHVYYKQQDGNLSKVAVTSTDVVRTTPVPAVTFKITDVNPGEGRFVIEAENIGVAKPVKAIKYAVWSEANQSNIHWYEATVSGTSSKTEILAQNHWYFKGDYITHAYVTYQNNVTEGFNLGETHLEPSIQGQKRAVLNLASSLLGVTGGSAEHAKLIEDYNKINPKPVGYTVKNTDDWCDIFVTVVFQRLGLSDLIGRECGVDRHIQIFKQLGIWNEDGRVTPQAGDIITFNWDQSTQQNDGFADHIGIVERVDKGIIHTIEGNSYDQVRRRTYPIAQGNIRGFATPRYTL